MAITTLEIDVNTGGSVKSLSDLKKEFKEIQNELTGLQPGTQKYIALLFQTGTSDPIAYVLENTLSSGITWVRDAVGEYLGTLTGEFTEYKTTVVCNNTMQGEIISGIKNNDKVQVYTYNSSGTATDGQLLYSTIEIRVYS